MKKAIFLFLATTALAGHQASASGHGKEPMPKLKCLEVSGNCLACDDGSIRDQKHGDVKKGGAYACVANPAQKEKKECVAVSGFCEVCPGDKFKLRTTDRFVSSDLYECLTHPRKQAGGHL